MITHIFVSMLLVPRSQHNARKYDLGAAAGSRLFRLHAYCQPANRAMEKYTRLGKARVTEDRFISHQQYVSLIAIVLQMLLRNGLSYAWKHLFVLSAVRQQNKD